MKASDALNPDQSFIKMDTKSIDFVCTRQINSNLHVEQICYGTSQILTAQSEEGKEASDVDCILREPDRSGSRTNC